MKNQLPFVLCFIGGVFLILAGYDHGIRMIFLVYTAIHLIPVLAPFYLVIDIALFLLGLIAWAGGYAVIFGGFLITTTHVRLGKFTVAIAAGFGLISFILIILWIYLTSGWFGLLELGWLIMHSIWALGLVLTIIARSSAK